MTANRFCRMFLAGATGTGLLMLASCGGGSSSHSTSSPPPPSCSVQVNAFDPPGPGGNNWNAFQKYVLPNTAIQGVALNVPWNSVETAQGQYDFPSLDSQFANYPGKIIDLIFQPISYSNINNPPGGVNTLTPSYVFTTAWASSLNPPSAPLDVTYCDSYPGNGTFVKTFANASVSNFDPTGFPVVYEAPFKVAYQNFINAVLQHYKGNANIGYMRFGLAVGNEADAFCTAELQLLPAPNTFVGITTWENWISGMESYEKSVMPSPPIQLMQSLNHLDTDPTYVTVPDFEAATAVSNGFGFGNNGLQKTDITNAASNMPCTGDWCAMFDKYAGQVPLELQESDPSNPSGSDPNDATGNLANLIPLAVSHHATILEILMDDLYLAYDPNYTPQPPRSPADSSFSGSYQTALNNPCATAQ
jgi:hypothetical protein